MTPRPDFGEMRRKALEAIEAFKMDHGADCKPSFDGYTLLVNAYELLALLDAHDNERAERLRQTKRAEEAEESRDHFRERYLAAFELVERHQKDGQAFYERAITAEADRDRLAAELEEVHAETISLDEGSAKCSAEAKRLWTITVRRYEDLCEAAEARAQAAETALAQRDAQIERLCEALKPFGPINTTFEDILWRDFSDERPATVTVSLGALRHARAVLENIRTDREPAKEEPANG